MDILTTTLSSKPITAPDEILCERMAVMLRTTPRAVADVIETANERGCAFHGIKHNVSVSGVRAAGIEPRSPEGRGGREVSFWTTGRRLFCSGNGEPGAGQDTTLFDYGHSYEPKHPGSIMTVAVTSQDMIRRITGLELPFEPDTHLELPYAVPPEALDLLRVEIRFTNEHGEQPGRIAEREMFKLIQNAVQRQNT